MRVFYLLCALISASQKCIEALTIQGPLSNLTQGLTRGSLSLGYASLAMKSLSIKDNSSTIRTGVMATVYTESNANISQVFGSEAFTGNHTLTALGSRCELHLANGTLLVSEPGHSSNIFCNGTWKVDTNVGISIAPQGNLLVLEDGGIESQANSTLEIGEAGVVSVAGQLLLEPNTRVTIGPNAVFALGSFPGCLGRVRSSADGYAALRLGSQALLELNGTISIGNGQSCNVTLGDSGELLVTKEGAFDIGSASLHIGDTSYWFVNGILLVDAYSTIESDVQSNLTINGAIKATLGAHWRVGSLASLFINGDFRPLQGDFFVERQAFFRTDKNTFIDMECGRCGLYLGAQSNFRMHPGAHLTFSPHVKLNISHNSALEIEGGAQCTLTQSFTIPPFKLVKLKQFQFKSWVNCY